MLLFKNCYVLFMKDIAQNYCIYNIKFHLYIENEPLCKLSISLSLKLKQMANSPKVNDINTKKNLGKDFVPC